MELLLCVGVTEWGIVPCGNRFFSKEETSKTFKSSDSG